MIPKVEISHTNREYCKKVKTIGGNIMSKININQGGDEEKHINNRFCIYFIWF
jgi:hypothetical protein